MELILNALLPLLVTGVLLVAGGLVGQARERKHHAELLAREAALQGNFVISQLKVLPDWATSGVLVTGSAVIASDYAKSFVAKFRALLGGEIKSFQTLMARARREAVLRAVDEARGQGAVGIANLRFETSNIAAAAGRSGMVAVEIFCFGTALIPARQPTPVVDAAAGPLA